MRAIFHLILHIECTMKIRAIFYYIIARLVSHRNRYDILFIIARLVYHRNTCSIFINPLHIECTIELWAIFLHVKHVQNHMDLLHFKYVQYFISIESCNCSWFLDKDSIYISPPSPWNINLIGILHLYKWKIITFIYLHTFLKPCPFNIQNKHFKIYSGPGIINLF